MLFTREKCYLLETSVTFFIKFEKNVISLYILKVLFAQKSMFLQKNTKKSVIFNYFKWNTWMKLQQNPLHHVKVDLLSMYNLRYLLLCRYIKFFFVASPSNI